MLCDVYSCIVYGVSVSDDGIHKKLFMADSEHRDAPCWLFRLREMDKQGGERMLIQTQRHGIVNTDGFKTIYIDEDNGSFDIMVELGGSPDFGIASFETMEEAQQNMDILFDGMVRGEKVVSFVD